MRSLSALLLGTLFAFGFVDTSHAASATEPAPNTHTVEASNLSILRALLKTPDDHLDFAEAKLTIDRMIDPTIDVQETHRQLNVLAAKIKARFPAGASSRDKLDIPLVLALSVRPLERRPPFQLRPRRPRLAQISATS